MLTKKGTVVKISAAKTIKVEVNEDRTHSKYKKQYRITKRFLAHDEGGSANVGDIVVIQQTRPISKLKTWKLVTEETK
jgi:small subunit ribosomal protein S17